MPNGDLKVAVVGAGTVLRRGCEVVRKSLVPFWRQRILDDLRAKNKSQGPRGSGTADVSTSSKSSSKWSALLETATTTGKEVVAVSITRQRTSNPRTRSDAVPVDCSTTAEWLEREGGHLRGELPPP